MFRDQQMASRTKSVHGLTSVGQFGYFNGNDHKSLKNVSLDVKLNKGYD